ncbi:hypothetical protein SDC9_165701 [bioreactor metagenome]|uniref:Uncharacterized protein n=1 Tax=bioreactor metagenome TaxID=1076179 RepID=A0A645FV01_9ZZZZ
MSDSFDKGNPLYGHAVNIVQPQPAVLFCRQAASDQFHQRGAQANMLGLVQSAEKRVLNRSHSANHIQLFIKRDGIVVIAPASLFADLIVSIGPAFPFQELVLAGKILAGQIDDTSNIYVDDGIILVLVQRVITIFIKHFGPSVSIF